MPRWPYLTWTTSTWINWITGTGCDHGSALSRLSIGARFAKQQDDHDTMPLLVCSKTFDNYISVYFFFFFWLVRRAVQGRRYYSPQGINNFVYLVYFKLCCRADHRSSSWCILIMIGSVRFLSLLWNSPQTNSSPQKARTIPLHARQYLK